MNVPHHFRTQYHTVECRRCGLEYSQDAWDKRKTLEGQCFIALQIEYTHVFDLIDGQVTCKYCGADEESHNTKCEA